MLSATLVPLAGVVAATLLARALPWRRLPPRVALWTLTVIAAVGAFATVSAAVVLAGGFLLGTPAGGRLVEACSLFTGHHRIPTTMGVAAVLGLGAGIWRLGSVVSAVRAQRIDGLEPLTVVATAEPIAFARTGRDGGVVVSTGMLAALEPAERRVLFAHERAHVRARHDLHLLVHELAAAVLPWLGGLRSELSLAMERVADSAALAEVRGDRRLVALAIARAAVAADRHGATAPAVAFVGSSVAFRVQSVLRPIGAARLSSGATLTLALVGVVSTSVLLHHLAALLTHVCL